MLPATRAKAPVRVALSCVTRAELEQALTKGKLKGALARAFKTGDLQIPETLPALIEDGLRKALLDRLGLEAKASMVLTGSEKIDVACRKGDVTLLLHAADADRKSTRLNSSH